LGAEEEKEEQSNPHGFSGDRKSGDLQRDPRFEMKFPLKGNYHFSIMRGNIGEYLSNPKQRFEITHMPGHRRGREVRSGNSMAADPRTASHQEFTNKLYKLYLVFDS
jgi:hypothetical protein